MSQLKHHAADVADAGVSDADRSESGAGIVVVILACLVLLGLVAIGGVVGMVVYVRSTRLQLEAERQRLLAMTELERAQAQLTAQEAERAAAMAEAQARFAEVLDSSPDAVQAPSSEPNEPPRPLPEEIFQGEIEPLNQAVMEHPDDPKVWQDRARALHRWRKWKEAADDYEHFLELNPNSLWMRLDAAVTRLASGNRDAYFAHCKLIEERLATKTQATIEHNRAARVLCLAPGALTSGENLLVTAQNEPLKDPGRWWLVEPMLALQYRTGRYQDAAQTIDELRLLAGFSGQQAATEVWAAMTYHQLGRADEARQALATAKELVANRLPPPGGSNAGGDAVIVSLVVIDEAKALIEGRSAEPAPEPASE